MSEQKWLDAGACACMGCVHENVNCLCRCAVCQEAAKIENAAWVRAYPPGRDAIERWFGYLGEAWFNLSDGPVREALWLRYSRKDERSMFYAHHNKPRMSERPLP